ncbi:MAG: aspartate kinase [Oscillospiraceae bacterium]|nr:aspartate kinase [Oscillospiraceae bacterium]
MRIVQKFGGSSVADAARIQRVAGILAETRRAGHQVVAVLSAQGDTTDELIEKARGLNPAPSPRELDALLCVGEQISVALMAMALEAMGEPTVSLTGWQIGLRTDSCHGAARIRSIDSARLLRELEAGKIVLVCGFQGIDEAGDQTTLGRGGSDTSAVAIAAALGADKCQIYTDVEGVYTADPRHVPGARKLAAVSYDEMLELASLGNQVLHNRSVELAKRYGVDLEVRSSFVRAPGTVVKEELTPMERMIISGVAKEADIARFTVRGLPDRPGAALRLFALLSGADINVDLILQSAGTEGRSDLSFTLRRDDAVKARALLDANAAALGYRGLAVDADVAKVSIVGAGLMDAPGMAVRMFEALAEAGVNIQMIASSEIKLSVLLHRTEAAAAVQAIHRRFFGDGD